MTISVSFVSMLYVLSGCDALSAVYEESRKLNSGKFQAAFESDNDQSGRLSQKYETDFGCHVLYGDQKYGHRKWKSGRFHDTFV